MEKVVYRYNNMKTVYSLHTYCIINIICDLFNFERIYYNENLEHPFFCSTAFNITTL